MVQIPASESDVKKHKRERCFQGFSQNPRDPVADFDRTK